MPYKIKIIKPNKDEGMELVFEINCHQYCAMGITPEGIKEGDEIESDINFLDADEITWEQMFNGNPYSLKALINKGDWRYEAYGEIVSIMPVIVNVGDFNLEIGNISNDERIIGEYIFFPVARLDVY